MFSFSPHCERLSLKRPKTGNTVNRVPCRSLPFEGAAFLCLHHRTERFPPMTNVLAELAFGKVYERVAAEHYAAKRWPGAQLAECAAYADIDFVVTSSTGKFLGFIETKARRISSTRYESTIVAYRKHDAARYGKYYFKVPTVCLVLFTDAVATFNLHEDPDGAETITRHDRGTSAPHALYAHSRFEWHNELLEPIAVAVRAEQGL